MQPRRHSQEGYELSEAANTDRQRRTLRYSVGAHDARAKLLRPWPWRSRGGLEGNEQMLAGSILTVTHETQSLLRYIRGHRFLEPQNVFRPDSHRRGQLPARARAAFLGARLAVSVAMYSRRRLKVHGDRSARRAVRIFRGLVTQMFSSSGAIAIGNGCASYNLRKNFRLPVAEPNVVRKSDPQGNARRMRFITGDEQASARSIERFADFGFLPQRSGPAKPHGKAQLGAVMRASVHNPCDASRLGGDPFEYRPLWAKAPLRTRTQRECPDAMMNSLPGGGQTVAHSSTSPRQLIFQIAVCWGEC